MTVTAEIATAEGMGQLYEEDGIEDWGLRIED
jgi:hypothetical protein